MSKQKPPFLRRVTLHNYKSIRECDVALGPLMLLVGPNGSGKSNFLDALRFVSESLRNTMDQALRERGGIKEVRRRSRGHPTHFAIELWLTLPTGEEAQYGFRVGARPQGGFEVQEEQCTVRSNGTKEASYHVREGQVVSATFQPPPPASTDRLYLTVASGFPDFRRVYDPLSGMGFYSINPDRLRDFQEPDAGNLLLRDGRNVASVLAWIEHNNNQAKVRIEEYLSRIASGIQHVDKKSLGHKETLEFRQNVAGDANPWSFSATNMSDGTLRALGVLVSLFQCFDRPLKTPVPLVGIEEPEATLHPAAASVLMSALCEASHYTQVLATSHSPDLLDFKDLDPDALLVVDASETETRIAPVDEASKSAVLDQLYTTGELLRLNQLQPQLPSNEPAVVAGDRDHLPLFSDE
jgi:predicted ATPase